MPLILPRILFIFIILCIAWPSYSQNADSTDTENTPFRKGRWIALINGSITSGSLSQTSSFQGKSFDNTYLYSLNGGYFVAKRLSAGLTLTASRNSFEEYITRESESFSIGPEVSFFFTKNEEGSLYLEYSPYYSRIIDRSVINDPAANFDKTLKGKGFGQFFGVGYAYVVRDLAILQVSFRYSYSWFNGTLTDQLDNSVSNKSFTNASLSYSFGIGLFLGK